MKRRSLNFLRYCFFLFLFLSKRTLSQENKRAIHKVTVKINAARSFQTIDNIGASAAWFSEGIGKYWPENKKEQLAEWLFSRNFDENGSPKGIGLSSFRFNIGGGTTEQGDSSGIKDFRKRVECFLQPDGTYDWTKQSGYLWFVRKAKQYGMEKLIAFSNTPPVQFTQNRLGYKTVKDYKSNLQPDKYGEYAAFLATVLQHFDKEGLNFNYISPVNEPQWDWSNKYGQASQEGSPWKNEDISKVVKALDSTLSLTHATSRILITEAGNLEYLYGHRDNGAGQQIQQLYQPGSHLQVNNLTHVLNAAGGHSYFTDNGDSNRITVRKRLADTVLAYRTKYWETEYSMLGDGYKEGKKGTIPAMDCALFLAKVLYDDFVYGNATAWQWWNSWEPGSPDFDTRYNLIALNPADKEYKDGKITATKNLWVLGQFSRFVRPGMKRVVVDQSDGFTDIQRAQKVMVTAFVGQKKLVIIAINYTTDEQLFQPSIQHFSKGNTYQSYVTTATKEVNMRYHQGKELSKGLILPPRSITTVVVD